MQKRPALSVQKRTVLGKQVKKLRREGLLPANVYGRDLKSVAVQVPMKEFETVFKEVGETGLVDLKLDSETRPVLVKNLQLEYPLRTPLHVDFYQVNLKEKVKTMVPLEFVGDAKAVVDNIGMLLTPLSEVEVEALPTDLPEKIEVSVEHLAALDEAITVENLKVPAGVEILTDPGQTVAKIAELVVEEPEPAPEEATEGEGAETGEEKAEGEESNSEKKEESPEEKTS